MVDYRRKVITFKDSNETILYQNYLIFIYIDWISYI